MENKTQETIENKIQETIEKAQDWWSRHNFGTRITLMTLLILTTITIIVPFVLPTTTHVIDNKTLEVARVIPHYNLILSAIVEATLWAFIIVTIGPNTIGKVAEAWVKYKGAK